MLTPIVTEGKAKLRKRIEALEAELKRDDLPEKDRRIFTKTVQVYREILSDEDEQVCRVCGCTWDNACQGGCYWVEEDLCSRCAPKEDSHYE